MTKRLLALCACLLTALLIAPAASAHETVLAEDEAYWITVGHQGEPAATFYMSGLDLIIRENDNGERGAEVPDLAGQLQATLVSPSGEELSQPLTVQFGSTGRYSFGDPYILTEPGQYKLELVGMVGDTDVTGTYNVSGVFDDFRDFTFPRTDVPTPLELQERITELEAENAALEQRMTQMEAKMADGDGTTSNGAPGLTPVLLIGALVALAFLRRR